MATELENLVPEADVEVEGMRGPKGDKGDSYVLTEADKEEIARKVDKIIDAETDKTLTLSGKPADAKAAGDAIDDLKADLDEIGSSVFDAEAYQPISVSDRGTIFINKSIATSESTDTGLRIKTNTGRSICRFEVAQKDGKVFVRSSDTTHSINVIVAKLVNPDFVPQSSAYSEQIVDGYTAITTILGEEVAVRKGDSVLVDYSKSYGMSVQGSIYKNWSTVDAEFIQQVQSGFSYDNVPSEGSSNAVNSDTVYRSLKDCVKTTFAGTGKNKFNKSDADNKDNVILDGTTGNESANTTYFTSHYIPVTAGKIYTLYNTYENKTSGRSYVFYDDQKTYISGANSFSSIGTAPEGAAYIRFCASKTAKSVLMLIEGLYTKDVAYEDYEEKRAIVGGSIIPEELDPLFISKSSSHNQYDPNRLLPNSSINESGYLTYNTTYYTSNVVYCEGYDVIITAFEIPSGLSPSTTAMNPRNIAFYDRNMDFIGMADTATYTYIWNVNGFAYTRANIPASAYFAIVGYTSGDTSIRKMIYCANGVNAFPLHKYEAYSEAFVVRNGIVKEKTYVESPYNGKTLNVIGDSITYGYGTYQSIQKAFPYLTGYGLNMAVNNYGINSSELAERSAGDTSHDPMCIRYVDMVDADVIVVAGGTNDWEHAVVTLGQMGDTVTTTFYGALDTMCRGLIGKYPDKIIIFMTPIKRSTYYNPNALGYIQEQFADAIKEVCAFYGIPVLDMFTKCTINPMIEVNRAKWLVDNTHPNQAGHRYMASMLTAYIASLAQ